LGTSDKMKLLEIAWPSGKLQRFTGLEANRILLAREPKE